MRFEPLEDRRMLALVQWDGGGDSAQWADPLNWTGDALPGPADDVVISAASDPVVQLSGADYSIRSLILNDQLRLLSGRLRVATTVTVGGELTFDGGVLVDATVSSSGNGRVGVRTGTLDGVTLNSNVTVPEGARLDVFNSLTLNSVLTLESSIQTGAELRFLQGQQTLQGSGQVAMSKWSALTVGVNEETTLTVAAGITIHGQGLITNNTFSTLVNRGTIVADVVNQSLTLLVDKVENRGAMRAVGGGHLALGDWLGQTHFENYATLQATASAITLTGAWSNASGVISTANSTLHLGGVFTLAQLGTLNRSGGVVNVFGTLDNANTTLTLNAQTGSWQLGGGAIRGGTVTTVGGAALQIAGAGTLDNVTLYTNMTVPEGARLDVLNGLTLNSVLTLESSEQRGAELRFLQGQQTLLGSGQVAMSKWSALTVGVNEETTLTVAAGMTIHGQGLITNNTLSTLVNRGTIAADVANQRLTVTATLLQNEGILRATGGGILDLITDVASSTSSAISSDASSYIVVRGAFAESSRNSSLHQAEGTVYLAGGDATAPKLWEIMSRDDGNVAAAYQKNFAIGTLLVGNGVTKLADSADNAAGVGPEALYANTIVVPAGATLDLNGLRVYARAIQIAGSVIGGTISQTPDSGLLSLATPTPGQIGLINELDEWSFSGYAGQRVTVLLNAGQESQPGAPAPVAAPIHAAEIQLVGPNDAILATRETTTGEGFITLSDFALPANGQYRLRVKAPLSHADRVGQYTIAYYDVTSDPSPLLLNQPVVGTLERPFNSDDWLLSLAAGQQVRLNVLNSAVADLRISLIGPQGYLAFNNIAGESDLVTIPEGKSGEYRLSVFSRTGLAGAYRLVLEETSVQELTPAQEASSSLSGTGAARLFRVSAPGGTPLNVTVDHSVATDQLEVYVRRSLPPTRSIFDARSESPGASHRVVVPAAPAGDWYVLVYGGQVALESDFAIRADLSSVTLLGVTPDHYAAAPGAQLTIRGAGFIPGTTVSLTDPALGSIAAQQVDVDSYTQLTALFDLSNAAEGSYSLQVTGPNGSTLLDGAFVVTAPGEGILETKIITDQSLGRHALATIYVEYANIGNAALPAPLIQLRSGDPDGSDRPILTLDPSLLTEGFWTDVMPSGFAHSVSLLASGTQPGILNPGERVRVPVYYAGLLQPWDFSDNFIEFGLSAIETTDERAMNWSGRTYLRIDSYSYFELVGGSDFQSLAEPVPGEIPGSDRVYRGSKTHELEWNGDFPPSNEEVRERLKLDPYPHDVIGESFDEPGVLQLQPPTVTRAAWEAIVANLRAEVGETLGDWIRVLSENGQSLARSGVYVNDIARLWGLEIVSASASLGPVSTLDAVTDLAMPTTGIPLALSRTFENGIASRYTSGPFGQGWQVDWDVRLTEEPGLTPSTRGAVILSTSTGSQVRYEPDARDPFEAAYFSGAGDSARLWKRGPGEFELIGTDGTLTHFAGGRPIYVQDTNGNRLTLQFDASDRLALLTHSNGAQIVLEYNGANRIWRATDSAGRSVTYGYDATNTYLLTVTTPDGKVTSYDYDTAGGPQTRHALESVTRGGATRTIVYDTRGRVDEIYLGNHEQTIDLGYGPGGLVTIDDGDGVSRLYYDDRGLLVRAVDPLGYATRQTFDQDYRLREIMAPTGDTRSFSWCDCGSLTSVTDELGYTTTFAYDHPLRRLTSFTDAKGNTTRYTYDTDGNSLSTVYPNQTVERLSDYTDAGLPGTSTNRRGQPISYTYTAAGLVDRQNFADGHYADFDYDPRGDLIRSTERLVDGTEEVSLYTYDYAQDGDRLRKVTYPNSRWVEYFYDAQGRRDRMTDSAGGDTRYEYDTAGRLWKLRDSANAVIVEYLYTPAGQLDRINKGNGTYTTYEYDAAGQILHLVNHAPDGSANSRFDYTYNSRGLRTAMGTLDGDWTYEYDATGQLTRAVFDSRNPEIEDQDLVYRYDALGNRTSTVINGVTTEYVANELNQYTSVGGVAFRYDADGNLTFDGERTYEYDEQNRLVRVMGAEGVMEYEYDALGNRSATTVNGVRSEFLLNPLGIVSQVAEYDASGVVRAREVNGLGIVLRIVGAAKAFYDFDALGSTVAVTNNGALVSNRYSYSPFGETILRFQSIENSYRFVGQFGVKTELSGLVAMRARFYSTEVGTFHSDDPIGLNGGNVNQRQYVKNLPTMTIDPTGLRSICEWQCRDEFQIARSSKGPEVFAEVSLSAHGPLLPGVALGGAYTLSTNTNRSGYQNELVVGGIIDVGAQLTLGTGNPTQALTVSLSSVNVSVGWNGGFSVGVGGSLGVGVPLWRLKAGGSFTQSFPNFPPLSAFGVLAVNAVDPNDKLPSGGFGPLNFVPADDTLPYRIRFENIGPGSVHLTSNEPFGEEDWATAPAQRVTIADQLDAALDWSTFEITELGFGDVTIAAPAGAQYFDSATLVTYDARTFAVQVTAGIDVRTGRVFATFQTLDPDTGLPPDVLTGFLLPESGDGRGKGYFSYRIKPKEGLPSGTQILNVARISFDGQTQIATNQQDPFDPSSAVLDPLDPDFGRANARVTIDAGQPTSQMQPLPAQSPQQYVELRWTASDDANGSGINGVDIYRSVDGGAPELFLKSQQGTSVLVWLPPNHQYAFYTIARDQVGHAELAPTTPDTVIRIIPGDTNADGVIDLNDLNGVRNNFGRIGDNIPGDTDLDGDVDLDDLNNLRNYFGAAAQSADAPNSLVADRNPQACIWISKKSTSASQYHDEAIDLLFGRLSNDTALASDRLKRDRNGHFRYAVSLTRHDRVMLEADKAILTRASTSRPLSRPKQRD